MKIRVTRDLIDSSVRRNSGHCMIADALKAAIPDAQYVLVDVQSIRYSRPSQATRYCHLTPLTAQRALVRFDRGRPVQPFVFKLPPVFASRPMGWIGQGRLHPHRKRKYESTGQRRLVVAYRERAFGLRNIPD